MEKEHSGTALLIWDAEGPPPIGDWTTVLWRSYNPDGQDNIVSIPQQVEDNAESLRVRYLAWIYEFGETRIGGKRIVDYFELRPGFSFWWMTSITQKFNALDGSPVNDAIKLLVFEKIIGNSQFCSINLISGNTALAATLRVMSKELGLSFHWNYVKQSVKPKTAVRMLYDCFPHSLKAFICIVRYIKKSFLLSFKNKPNAVSYGDVSFIDVLAHLDYRAFTTGRFVSNYWTALVDELDKAKIQTNWFHIYFYQESIQDEFEAQKLLKRFNASSGGLQSHSLVDVNLSAKVILNAIKLYLKIGIASIKLHKINILFRPAGSSINLWPMFRNEWIASLRGAGSVIHCLEISQYEDIFKNINFQKVGFYIQENQPWEMALIHAWRSAGHGKLIGIAHTTVRFWDLRYFYDSRSYGRNGENLLPIPDKVAVNGLVARRNYICGGYPESNIVDVEALRFMHLLDSQRREVRLMPVSNEVRILVCGDFLETTTRKMLSWLVIAAKLLPHAVRYIFKPHPAFPVKTCDFPSLMLEVSNAPLSELFCNCDVVFTSNITSASVDAYCAGIPVLQMLEGEKFNMSPLRGFSGGYVKNPNELADALRKTFSPTDLSTEPYFFLNSDLRLWKDLLCSRDALNKSANS